MMLPRKFLTVGAAILVASAALAQTPVPVVNAAEPAVANLTAPVQKDATSDEALKALQELKAANDNLLRRQAATLQQLEELEKAADQMRVYSRR